MPLMDLSGEPEPGEPGEDALGDHYRRVTGQEPPGPPPGLPALAAMLGRDLAVMRQQLDRIEEASVGHETMLGLIAQMLAAASPAAARVMADFVSEGQDEPTEPAMPQGFASWYNQAGGENSG